ncbi:formin-like protein 11 [Cucumis melo var. makuwa]|uniref:Formin-like protein 11 n=1 Tax=Cucumis melo var. makuwa TaxID=1194695 RepID=A0A5D3BRW5_CUCMM|nr:formin-like protein 11 [Cucumis melo var. makuwa]
MEKLSVKSEREDKTARPKSSLDLFDLGMLGMDVEEQTHTSESEKELSVHKEGERSEEMLDSKFDNVSVSSTKEVMYAREEDDSKSIQCVSNGTHSSSGDKITLVQCCLSNDEESFHSCGDSNFLNRRLSNASETSSANVITNSTCSVPTANLAKSYPLGVLRDHHSFDTNMMERSDGIAHAYDCAKVKVEESWRATEKDP